MKPDACESRNPSGWEKMDLGRIRRYAFCGSTVCRSVGWDRPSLPLHASAFRFRLRFACSTGPFRRTCSFAPPYLATPNFWRQISWLDTCQLSQQQQCSLIDLCLRWSARVLECILRPCDRCVCLECACTCGSPAQPSSQLCEGEGTPCR